MKKMIKILVFILSLSSICAFAEIQQNNVSNANTLSSASKADIQSMDQMSKDLMKYKLKKIGYKLMLKGNMVYALGKYMTTNNDNDMQMKGQKMMETGIQMYATGKLLSGSDLDMDKLKKMMMNKQYRKCR